MATSREEAADGLRRRIDWMVRADRKSEEISKAVDILMVTLEECVRDDALDQFYQKLADLDPKLEK